MNMKIHKVNIISEDLISGYLPADFEESLECTFFSNKIVTADDIQVLFWTDSPKWIKSMFALRGKIVELIGLKSGKGKDSSALENCIRRGGSYQMTSIPEKSADETILCLNDSHLVMYFSIKVTSNDSNLYTVKASTLVQFHKMLGRIYFYVIYPFHWIIVHAMLRSVVRRIENLG